MDAFGTHPLSSHFSAGRIPSNSALNDVDRRGFSAARIPSMHELSGLDRGDGKRPDGATVCHCSRGHLDASDVHASGSGQLQANPHVAGPWLYPGKPTRRAVTTGGSDDLVVGEDHMLGPSCQRHS